jgi:mRNA-degrading endonuclease toxin of MazEF toxin-antitoxin module
MANGKFERGEMYWFKFGDSLGSEMAAGRPGVIVSANKGNETSPALLVAMVTRQPKYLPVDVKTMVGGVARWVVCNQVMVIDKSRVGNYIGTLSLEETKALDSALEEAFDLGYVDDTKDKEIEDRDAEIAALKAKIAGNDDVVASMKMEIEMWKKCYDRAMDMLVQTKVNADVSRRMAKVEVSAPPKEPERVINTVEPEPVVPEEPKSEPMEQEPLVEINTCSAEDLKRCGCSPVVIENIINARPYMALDELRVVNGVTSVAYGLLKHKLCCVPVKVEEPEQKIEESVVVVEAEAPEAPVVEPVVEP